MKYPLDRMLAARFSTTSTMYLAIAAAIVVAAVAVAWIRRVRIHPAAAALIVLGMAALALAAGGLKWLASSPNQVTVMVDLSGSTRGARYRDARYLRQRIDQLLGRTPCQIIYFAAENRPTAPEGEPMGDLPGDRTVYAPPASATVLLFSDSRFELPPAGPRTYVVVDPLLDGAADGRIERLEIRGEKLAAAVDNQTPEIRPLEISGTNAPRMIDPGQFAVVEPLPAGALVLTAFLRGDDLWPENDRLAIRIPSAESVQRWWVGSGAPGGWRAMSAGSLPLDSAEYLAAAVIVLNNVAATEFSDEQQVRLVQYVRDLGGAVVILGGDRAFAAGGYTGTHLDSMSPLASSPPEPKLHWILLADSSGSMADGVAGTTRWDLARDAVLRLLPHLPPEDPVTIGSFAQSIRWWSRGRTAKETAALPLPPADVLPSGPTNLEPALFDIISRADAAYPKQLLILSDADADITQIQQIREGLAQKKIQLFLLDTYGKGRGLEALRQLANASGGRVLQELDPKKWVEATRKLLEMAAPDRLMRTATEVRFSAELSALSSRPAELWNRVWLRPRASVIAQTMTSEGQLPLAARWQLGAGQVLSAAFALRAAELDAMANLAARRPKDPRFRITWDTGSKLRVSVDAVDGKSYLNEQALTLELSGDESGAKPQAVAIPQTGPGRYELAIDAPRRSVFAAVLRDGGVVERIAVAGRYAPEFDGIGNDRAAMKELAERTGGRVIEPSDRNAIKFDWPKHEVPLVSYLAAAGALLIATGLIWWRLG